MVEGRAEGKSNQAAPTTQQPKGKIPSNAALPSFQTVSDGLSETNKY